MIINNESMKYYAISEFSKLVGKIHRILAGGAYTDIRSVSTDFRPNFSLSK